MNGINLMPLPHTRFGIAIMASLLAGCTVGPSFHAPATSAPADWTSWRSGDAGLHRAPGPIAQDRTTQDRTTQDRAAQDRAAQDAPWWHAFGDPVLDELERRAMAASPDLQTAALHFAQSRVARRQSAAQGLPQVNASAGIERQQVSQYGPSTRLLDAVAGNNRDALAKILGEPYTLYQGGFDASWEIDLWGKVRRSLEAADAQIAEQAALLDAARLSVACDVALSYSDYRAADRRIRLLREDIAAARDRLALITARKDGGLGDASLVERQRADLGAAEAQLPALLAQQAGAESRIALLLGQRPGTLGDVLQGSTTDRALTLPDLTLGLPSAVALGRPDVRAALDRLHAATAQIGVAKADLYPSIRLGASLDLQSYQQSHLFDWASHDLSFGPTIDLPLFDGARRKAVVHLRELEQKEAAVAYEQTVLKAWAEINDALNLYAATDQQAATLRARRTAAQTGYDLIAARVAGGIGTRIDAIDTRRAQIAASRDLIDSESTLARQYITVIKATGNGGS